MLKDAPRSGRKQTITAEKVAEVVTRSTQSRPEASTHWSRSTMAREVGIFRFQRGPHLALAWPRVASC
jgi:hypothetical protein